MNILQEALKELREERKWKTYTWEEAVDYIEKRGYKFDPDTRLYKALEKEFLNKKGKIDGSSDVIYKTDLLLTIGRYGEPKVDYGGKYPMGFSIRDPKTKYSYFRGLFKTIEEAILSAEKYGYYDWEVAAYNKDTGRWDTLLTSKDAD